MHKALIKLVEHCEEIVCREHSIQNVVKIVNDTNLILLVRNFILRIHYPSFPCIATIAFFMISSVCLKKFPYFDKKKE